MLVCHNIVHHKMSLLISCYILDTFNKLSSFHISIKSSPLIFEQIFSGWFTCPTANGACQACQNILRAITIYSSTTNSDCVLLLTVKACKRLIIFL